MWKKMGCTLTNKDHDVLQRLLEQHQCQNEAMTWLLRHKLDTARVVTSQDVPEDVATLNSRISFQVGSGQPETRIISLDRSSGPVGCQLPITTMRGLALLGLAEGQTIAVSRSPSLVEIIQVTAVHYQPERTERSRGEIAVRPKFRVLQGGIADPAPFRPGVGPRCTGDDPGPSAA